MQEYLNQLSNNLIFISKEIDENTKTIVLNCKVKRNLKHKIHSYFQRKIKDINYGSYKIILNIQSYKYYLNRKNSLATISYDLDFVDKRTYMTKRLSDFILEGMKESSAIGLERTIKKSVANVSDSTILRLVKKNTKE